MANTNYGEAIDGVVVTFATKVIHEWTGISHDGITVTDIPISSKNDEEGWMDFLQGKKDAGTLELKLRAAARDHETGDVSPLYWIALGKGSLVFTFPKATGQSVAAYVTVQAYCKGDALPAGEQNNPAERTLRFKLCGKPTFTAAVAA